jgi:putative hydrolase of the HAD superfamily
VPANNKTGCVTFDLWETLIFDKPDRDDTRGGERCEGLQHGLAVRGVDLAMDEIERAYEESAIRFQEVWQRNEEVSIPDQIRLIIELAAGRSITIDHDLMQILEKAYVDPILVTPPILNVESPKVLGELRSRGYKIGLISNTGRSPGEALRQLLQTYGILRFFNATVFSNELGVRKPNQRIFNEAARLLGAEPANIVHVGDDPTTDITGAKNAGMHAILLDQDTQDASKWKPDSLFALARKARRYGNSNVEPDLRIKSLTESVGFIDSLFTGTQ